MITNDFLQNLEKHTPSGKFKMPKKPRRGGHHKHPKDEEPHSILAIFFTIGTILFLIGERIF